MEVSYFGQLILENEEVLDKKSVSNYSFISQYPDLEYVSWFCEVCRMFVIDGAASQSAY